MVENMPNLQKWEKFLYGLIKENKIIPNTQLYKRIKDLKGCPSKNTIIRSLKNLCVDKKIFKIQTENGTVYYAIDEKEDEQFQSDKKIELNKCDLIIEQLTNLSNKSENEFINAHQLLQTFQKLIEKKNECLEKLHRIENIQGVPSIITLRDVSNTENISLAHRNYKDKTWFTKYSNVIRVEEKLFKSEYNITGKTEMEREKERESIKLEYEEELTEFYKIDDKYFKLNKRK